MRKSYSRNDFIFPLQVLTIAYLNLTQNRELEIEQKKEIFRALLMASSGLITDEGLLQFCYITPEMIVEAFRKIVPTIGDQEKEQSTLDE